MKKQLLHWAAFVLIFAVAFTTAENPWSTRYLDGLKEDSITVSKAGDSFYQKIEDMAQRYDKPAIDAVNDRVWKGIPGYNGLKVNVEASYKQMKKEGTFDKDQLVIEETEPDVHLGDITPVPIFKGNPKKPMVSLMVNVAWGNEFLEKILKVMEKENVHATFFLDGSWVKKNPDLAKRIIEGGHEIGNHAYSHPDLKQSSPTKTRSQLQKTQDVIDATLDIKPKLFAPPSGSFNSQTVKIADDLHMKTILWTLDTIDWKKPPPQAMSQRILQNVHSGTLILMHPTSPTAEGLKSIIEGIRDRGYHIGTVSNLLSEERL